MLSSLLVEVEAGISTNGDYGTEYEEEDVIDIV